MGSLMRRDRGEVFRVVAEDVCGDPLLIELGLQVLESERVIENADVALAELVAAAPGVLLDGLGEGEGLEAAKTPLIGSVAASVPPTPTSAAYLRNDLRSFSFPNWITERPSKRSWST